MKNKKKLEKVLIVTLFVLSLLAGCGKAANDMAASEDMKMEESSKEYGSNSSVMDYESPAEDTETATEQVSDNRKIIEKVYLQVETKEFDTLMEHLSSEIAKTGGYIESSSVSGNSYRYDGNRYADMVVRVPKAKSSEFTDFVSENSTVTNKEISTDDVTLSYIDMESRVAALKTEKESLERLLAAAENLEDIIKIQDRLTDVIYEIESYQSQLRMYDNLIEYTTVTIRINEVEKVTIIEEQTVWEEIGTKLKDNFQDVGEDFVDLFVGIVSNLPYILVWAAIIMAVVFTARKVWKKIHRKKYKIEDKEEVKK